MLETALCGCPTKPIDKFYKVKKYLLAGDVIWFDDPRCEEHQGGSGVAGYMCYAHGNVYTQIRLNDEEEITGIHKLDQAIEQLSIFNEADFDFAYSKASIEQTDDGVVFVCQHNEELKSKN